MTTTKGEAVRVGAVVRDRMLGVTHTGTLVRTQGRAALVAWHHSFVEDELDIDQVEIWADARADAPDELRQWRGGIGKIDPDGVVQVRGLSEAQ